ncbi:outer membrane protein [Bartonella sp. DGB2]|uniref:outer membrane protein n=1 Tax=Bartonella sp. DGB2 TaxID=3388426 RepID=UPI00398FE3D3
MRLKYFIGASTMAMVLAVSAQTADAADVIVPVTPSRPAVIVPPQVPAESAFSWAGFYLGAELANGWGQFSLDGGGLPAPTGNFSTKVNGFLGGVFAGYNVVSNNGLVFGVETDWGFSQAKGQANRKFALPTAPDQAPPPEPFYLNEDITVQQKWLGATRVRLGFAADRLLPYIAGGVAYTRLDEKQKTFDDYAEPDSGAGPDLSQTLVGYTLGAGFDYALSKNSLVRLEYRYNGFSKQKLDKDTFGRDFTYSSNDVRVGVAFKF